MARGRGRPPSGRQYDGYGVYLITCTVNSRVYVGSSTTVYNRLCQQKCRLRRKLPSVNKYLLADYVKYGESFFNFEIIKKCESLAHARKEEQNIIDYYDNSWLLYNANRVTRLERTKKEKKLKDRHQIGFLLKKETIETIRAMAKEKEITQGHLLEHIISKYKNNAEVCT